jgi:glucose-6-phosphate 1-dehydrogenase
VASATRDSVSHASVRESWSKNRSAGICPTGAGKTSRSYLRTGKALATRASQACIQFRPVPHRSFPPSAARTWEPNRLVLQIQPEEGIRLRFQAEHPGASETLTPVDMQFRYRDFFAVPTPDAYETLLLDVLLADATLFMRADQVEAAWAIADPILSR